ncbi:hypothetical protein SKAU_G00143510 [Synaphobranchus kaupii]|uniref:Uncharacterized protein n=1 Tax=Synaphobranchus kaupii TaxID=118154 RepID=A0A9Q1FTM8_SYNKA|nr:hypothetical protein SKAU_G00143510 [Synaphobranchus kaupii]
MDCAQIKQQLFGQASLGISLQSGTSTFANPGNMTTRRWNENFAFLTVLYVLSLTVKCSGDNELPNSSEGNGLDPPEQQSTTGKLERHETTVPYLLSGGERRPATLLRSMSHPASVKLLIEAENEQLVLALEKNEPRGRRSCFSTTDEQFKDNNV